MLTEVYLAKHIPPIVPEFVDDHITCEDDGTYLFEINPNHPFVKNLRDSGKIVKDFLEEVCGFKGVMFIYLGEAPNR